MKKRITAGELMRQLEADPDFVQRRDQSEANRLRKVEELNQAELPLVESLRSIGIKIQSIDDMVHCAEPYPEAIPVLLEHFQRPYPHQIREAIARSLAVPDAIVIWDTLKKLYQNEQEPHAKVGLAVALAGAANDSVIGDVIALLKDKTHGESRLCLLEPLEKSKDERARKALMDLGSDMQLAKEIQVILRHLK